MESVNGSTGLVYSSTTRTPPACRVDLKAVRLSRLRRASITGARLFTQGLQCGGVRFRAAFETLTYRDASDWSACHIRDYLHARRKWFQRRGLECRYMWVAELQKRGALHYHVLWFLPRGVTLPMADKRGLWRHGQTNIQWARNAVGYMAKYASKSPDGEGFPKGARLHGRGGLDEVQRTILRWWLLPAFVRDAGGSDYDWVRATGGGFVSRSTGETVSSGWQFSRVNGGFVTLLQVERIPRSKAWPDAAALFHAQCYREQQGIDAADLHGADRLAWLLRYCANAPS